MNPIDIALRIATSAHAGQLDRDGYPVILHPLTVGLMGHADEEKMAAFLHEFVGRATSVSETARCTQYPGRIYRRQRGFSFLCRCTSHKTHHVEAVIVEFYPQQVSYESLCKLFFEIHAPAQTDGVGPDLRPQYRSCIFYRNESQKQTAEHVTELLRSKGDEVNTLLLPEETFYIGEAYHQHYYEKTDGEPYCHLRTKKF